MLSFFASGIPVGLRGAKSFRNKHVFNSFVEASLVSDLAGKFGEHCLLAVFVSSLGEKLVKSLLRHL